MSGVPPVLRERRMLRNVAHALKDAGFAITDAWHGGRHIRVRVSRAGREGVITVASSPACRDHAPHLAVQAARRALRAAGSIPAS